MYNCVEEILFNPTKYEWIVFGAGGYARTFINKFCLSGILPMPKYVCDNDETKWNTEFIGGLIIHNPQKIMDEDYRNTVIVIATHWMAIVDQFRHMGAYYYMTITSKTVEDVYYIRQNEKRFHRVEEMFEDDLSKELFHTKIQDYLRGIIYAPSCVSYAPYYGNDLIRNLEDNDVIVAGGCYNGDHIDRALELNSNVKIYAFEPNRKYADYLREKYDLYGNVIIKENALYDDNTELLLDNSVDMSAHVMSGTPEEYCGTQIETIKIKAVRLDDTVGDDVSMIWMDIEGSELSALRGGRELLTYHRPKLAICVYHLIEHYVEIAELVKEYNPNYKLFFRHHSTIDSESVLYAI